MRSDAGGPDLASASAGASLAPAVSDLSERELIARVRARLPPPPPSIVVGIGDDGAVVEPERNRLEVLSVDALVEHVHFDRRFTPPAAIGHRALAVNLSDLAAMGASPRLALLSLVLPPELPLTDFDGIVAGLCDLAQDARVHLIGGNLARSPGPMMIDVTVVGTVKRRGVLTRAGASAGDELYVSGPIGAAAAGLRMLQASVAGSTSDAIDERLAAAYQFPMPRIRLGVLLGRNRAASACMDLSDGLADAVHTVTAASGVGATVEADALPIDAAARHWFERSGVDPVETALSGGDDYELLVAVHPRHRRRFEAAVRPAGTALTRVGVCTPEPAVVLRRGGADTPLVRGFHHFR
jgi:thiamine-monophosphate kinase